jgi:hypothetical protein
MYLSGPEILTGEPLSAQGVNKANSDRIQEEEWYGPKGIDDIV